jgi:pyrroline-5-carboxylate reductase
MTQYSFIGAGNMATAIIGSLVRSGVPAANICAADPSSEQRHALENTLGIRTTGDNAQACAQADVVVLAVKPQVMRAVLQALGPALPDDALLLSIAAGITLASIEAWAGKPMAVVRTMPNTPCLVGTGATGLLGNARVMSDDDTGLRLRTLALDIFTASGEAEFVENEHQLDIITALSGSGPAYGFLLMEAMTAAAVNMGLSESLASRFAIATLRGAGELAYQDAAGPAALRQRVTSPGGTTAAALESFEAAGFARIVDNAMQAALQRAGELANNN